MKILTTLEKLKKFGKKLTNEAKIGKNPNIDIPVRSLANVVFDKKAGMVKMGNAVGKRYLFNVAHIRKFVQTLEVATTAKELLRVNKHLNLREVYYRVKRTLPGTDINIVDEQTETNKAIEDLELITGVPREQLHINADKEGVAAGKVVILDKGDTINWSKLGSGGWSVPSNVENIKFKDVDAKFIIYLEKMATWERLHEDRIWEKLNCIIIASRGQSTRGIRRLLQRLSTEHNLPIYVLVDGDPWGIYIYSVLKYGSISLAHMAETLVIPKAKYLGLSADDIEKYGLKKNIIKFKDVDIKRLKQMQEYDWFKDDKAWQRQFKKWKDIGGKVELAALTSRGISFISDTYIPEKIKKKDWLE
ncbi:MAG: DNA topoisomerase IV subunit A [Nanoarchaeota archaeon]|nr:DNA topoisomerase IV subunit A [Nanoarchaeota archaeon]